MTPLLQAQAITKTFGGIVALDRAHLELWRGEVHALMGENGAGKSTLARILTGTTRADRGQIRLDGELVSIDKPLDAQSLAIGIIHQELDLFPHLTVGENVVIRNLQYAEHGRVNQKAIASFCRPFLEQVGLRIDPRTWVADLPIAQQQLLAIARALSMNCRILFMDEPTSALSEDAQETLFEVIAGLKAKGVSIVYVSHKMEEIFRLCDRATVLRDGNTVGTCILADTERDTLIRMMVGRDLEAAVPCIRTSTASIVLSVEKLTTDKLRSVSFELHKGEVLGLAGLVGAGRSELGAALLGLERIHEGRLRLKDAAYCPTNPAKAQQRGLGMVPEDRKIQGLMPQMSVRENTTLSVLPRLGRFGLLEASREDRIFEPAAQRLRLKCPSPRVAVSTLSGGNQQKALLGRSIMTEPDVLFLDDPTRGVDVAAKEDIYRLIHDLAARGTAILLASSELAELMRCAHRILVLNSGSIAAEFPVQEATQESIMAAAISSPRDLAKQGDKHH
jgi:ribose transport system ATP-binding protein